MILVIIASLMLNFSDTFNHEEMFSDNWKNYHSESTKDESEELIDTSNAPKATLNYNSLWKHLHNKIVHFPVALSILGLLFSLIKIKKPEFIQPLIITIAIALVAAGIAYLTGEPAEEAYKGLAPESVIERHQLFGTFTAICYLIWMIFLIIKPLRKYDFIIGFAAVAVSYYAGFLGGFIAHTQ
jgi:uncharacterized membrane protein